MQRWALPPAWAPGNLEVPLLGGTHWPLGSMDGCVFVTETNRAVWAPDGPLEGLINTVNNHRG